MRPSEEVYTYRIATCAIVAATLLAGTVVSAPIGYALWLAFRSY